MEYTCRKCRRRLFASADVMLEVSGSVFLAEPLEWMAPVAGDQGTISCPNARCATKLGGWRWNGMKVPEARAHGGWVAPAFQVTASRIAGIF